MDSLMVVTDVLDFFFLCFSGQSIVARTLFYPASRNRVSVCSPNLSQSILLTVIIMTTVPSRAPVQDEWTQYISLCGVRTHSELGHTPISELIYVHSKALIADDRRYIIGETFHIDRP